MTGAASTVDQRLLAPRAVGTREDSGQPREVYLLTGPLTTRYRGSAGLRKSYPTVLPAMLPPRTFSLLLEFH